MEEWYTLDMVGRWLNGFRRLASESLWTLLAKPD
jgi:hypothetical protein